MNKKNFLILSNLILGFFITSFLILTINYYIDPYNFNKNKNIIIDNKNEAYRFNERLLKIKKFENKISKNILIGNSVMDDLKATYFKNYDIANVSYGGGTVEEIFETFNYLTSQYKIKNAIIGISIMDYNHTNDSTDLKQTLRIINNKLLYYFNLDILIVSLKIIKNNFVNSTKQKEIIKINDNEIWQNISNYQSNLIDNYKISEVKLNYLNKIINTSKKQNINLLLVLPPMHISIIELINKNLEDDSLNKFNTIINSNHNINYFKNNKFNKDKNNFKDPLHLSDIGIKKVVYEIESSLKNLK